MRGTAGLPGRGTSKRGEQGRTEAGRATHSLYLPSSSTRCWPVAHRGAESRCETELCMRSII